MLIRCVIGRWLLALILFVGGASAQIVPGEYIVELVGEPAIPLAAVKAPRPVAARTSVRAAQARVQALLERNNVEVLAAVDTVLNALMVRTADVSALNGVPGVARVYPVRMYKTVMDRAVGVHKITAAGALIGGSENAGAGIKIGIIDTGVDVSHPAFNDAGFRVPDGFPRVNKDTDTRYTNNKVIVARNYDKTMSSNAADKKGHGTSVAAVAAAVRNVGPSASFMGWRRKRTSVITRYFPMRRRAPRTARSWKRSTML